MFTLLRRTAAVLAILALSLVGTVALADATVIVTVTGEGDVPEGQVVLTPRAGGDGHSCQTANRTCRIQGVPSGSYTVQFQPASGPTPRPQTAMIGGDGEVRLTVYAGDRR